MKTYLEFINEYSNNLILNLKKKFKEEISELSDTQMDYYINSFDKYKNSPKIINKDITKYTFSELEKLIDSNFPNKTNIKNNEDFSNEAIYNENGLEIYEGDTREKCIKCGHGEKWCISRDDASNMFNTYRYRYDEINFYFIFDKERTDEFSKIVLLVDKNDNYYLANRNNSGDFAGSKKFKWKEIVKIQPKIKDLRDLFKSKPLTAKERETYNKVKSPMLDSVNDLIEYFKSYDVVEAYISYGHKLTDSQFSTLDTELQIKYINLGHDITFNQFETIKKNKKVLNRFSQITNKIINDYVNKTNHNGYCLYLSYVQLCASTLPSIFYGDLDLASTTDLILYDANFKLPDTIIGNLDLGCSTLPENMKFPKTIDGDLRLYHLTSLPNNVIFPETVTGKIYILSELKKHKSLTHLQNHIELLRKK